MYLMKTPLITSIFLLFLFTSNANADCIKGKCVKGKGTWTLAGGSTYTGDFANRIITGEGTFT